MGVEIKIPEAQDRDAWQKLYQAYAEFYHHDIQPDGLAKVWAWLHDPGHPLEVRLALKDQKVVGLMHFRAMPRPLHAVEIGFLDDLFVDPSARGNGLAEMMLEELASIGRERGWSIVRWLTADDNYRARGLYDRVAKKTAWNLYEMGC